jgi:hypothetical protein
MLDMKDASRQRYSCSSVSTMEEIKVGAIQRIADGVEKMAGSYQSIIDSRDWYKMRYEDLTKEIRRLDRKNQALRGVITRMKRRAEEAGR